MRIKITGTEREVRGDESLVISRNLQLALSRFDGLVSMATVIVDGPAEASLQLRLRLRTGESIEVCERNPDPTTAARMAAQRAASVLDRNRSPRRAPRNARIRAGV